MTHEKRVLSLNQTADDRMENLFSTYQELYGMFPDEHATELDLEEEQVVDLTKVKELVKDGTLPYDIYSVCSVRRNKDQIPARSGSSASRAGAAAR